jgi:hypothetical protein
MRSKKVKLRQQHLQQKGTKYKQQDQQNQNQYGNQQLSSNPQLSERKSMQQFDADDRSVVRSEN